MRQLPERRPPSASLRLQAALSCLPESNCKLSWLFWVVDAHLSCQFQISSHLSVRPLPLLLTSSLPCPLTLIEVPSSPCWLTASTWISTTNGATFALLQPRSPAISSSTWIASMPHFWTLLPLLTFSLRLPGRQGGFANVAGSATLRTALPHLPHVGLPSASIWTSVSTLLPLIRSQNTALPPCCFYALTSVGLVGDLNF